MKATTVKKILSKLSEDCMEVNERRNKKGVAPISYQLTIKTSNREYRYDIDEDSNWNVEDGILWLEDNEGTRWIDLDKIESINM